MKQGTLSDPRMRETYQNFLGKQSSNVRNVPGQDFAMSKQGQAGLQGRLQSQYGKGYRSPGSQVQASVRNPSNEQAGIAQPAQPPAQQAPMQKAPTLVGPAAAGPYAGGQVGIPKGEATHPPDQMEHGSFPGGGSGPWDGTQGPTWPGTGAGGGSVPRPSPGGWGSEPEQLKNLQLKPMISSAEQNQANWQKQQQNKNLVGSTMPVKDPYQLQQQNYDIMGVR